MVAMTTGSRGDGLPFDKAVRGRGGSVEVRGGTGVWQIRQEWWLSLLLVAE